MPLPKPPRVIRMLAEHGGDALKATIERGRYVGPIISPRKAKMVRKRAIVEGTFGSFCPQFGGWLEEWDTPRKTYLYRVPKGHLRDRNREKRADKITKALDEMPKKIEAYEKDAKTRKPDKVPLKAFRNALGIGLEREL